MTRQRQYAHDLDRVARLLEGGTIMLEVLGTVGTKLVPFPIKDLDALAARLRNYGCLNPFREPDKKVERKRK